MCICSLVVCMECDEQPKKFNRNTSYWMSIVHIFPMELIYIIITTTTIIIVIDFVMMMMMVVADDVAVVSFHHYKIFMHTLIFRFSQTIQFDLYLKQQKQKKKSKKYFIIVNLLVKKCITSNTSIILCMCSINGIMVLQLAYGKWELHSCKTNSQMYRFDFSVQCIEFCIWKLKWREMRCGARAQTHTTV